MRALYPLIGAVSAVLASIAAAAPVSRPPITNIANFVVKTDNLVQSKHTGKSLSARRISDHILHVGVHVKSPEAQDRFYRDSLGFRLLWQGGPWDDRFDWISLLTPNGDNWIEYTRTEVMIRKPVQKVCCSENMDPYIK